MQRATTRKRQRDEEEDETKGREVHKQPRLGRPKVLLTADVVIDSIANLERDPQLKMWTRILAELDASCAKADETLQSLRAVRSTMGRQHEDHREAFFQAHMPYVPQAMPLMMLLASGAEVAVPLSFLVNTPVPTGAGGDASAGPQTLMDQLAEWPHTIVKQPVVWFEHYGGYKGSELQSSVPLPEAFDAFDSDQAMVIHEVDKFPLDTGNYATAAQRDAKARDMLRLVSTANPSELSTEQQTLRTWMRGLLFWAEALDELPHPLLREYGRNQPFQALPSHASSDGEPERVRFRIEEELRRERTEDVAGNRGACTDNVYGEFISAPLHRTGFEPNSDVGFASYGMVVCNVTLVVLHAMPRAKAAGTAETAAAAVQQGE